LNLRNVEHGTRCVVLRFEGASETTWADWESTLTVMIDALSRGSDFRVPKTDYRRRTGLSVTEGIEFEWSNGDATIWSDVPHEIIVIFDGRLRPRKAEALVHALMNVWKDISG